MKEQRHSIRQGYGLTRALGRYLAVILPLLATTGRVASAPFVPEQILVKPKAGVNEAALRVLFATHGAAQAGIIRQIDVRILRVPEERLAVVLNALQHNPNIEFAEPNHLLEPDLVPNDTYYSLEWQLAKISAPVAWDTTVGSSNVVIAILDSGIESTHPDLAPLLVPGWNFIDNNSNTADVRGHGTSVAGAAAAASNNGQGVASVAWQSKLMPVRIADTNGYAWASAVANGLVWAADHGARVANISYANVSKQSSINTAAQYFQSKRGVVTISAGNAATFDSTADNPLFVMVSATDNADALASWSNTGNNVDLAAPGVNIVTTGLGSSYGYASGTSYSAPIVAGVAALVLSVNPSLTPQQVNDLLKSTTDDLGPAGWDASFGSGRVNAARAVQAAAGGSSPPDTVPPSAGITSPAGGAVVSNLVTVNVSASDNVGVTKVEWYLSGVLAGSTTVLPAVFTWDTTASANGSRTLQARAYDAAGNFGDSPSVTVSVQNPTPDTTAPTVSLTAPTAGSTVSGVVTVRASATDNVGVTKVQVYLDGLLAGTSTLAVPSFSWDTTKSANGSHTLQSKAYDAAGNVGVSALVNVTVQNGSPDTTAPTVQITSPTTGTTVGKTVKIYVAAGDNKGVTRVDLFIDGNFYQSSTSASAVFNWNTTKAARGTHTLQAFAYDAAGNKGTSALVTVNK